MSLYYRTLYAWKCKGTHHKLAMEALRLLSSERAEDWRDLFLRYIEPYLAGSKDPDKKFKDFRNHVLHVDEEFWGGAPKAAQEWYAKSRQHFADGQWKQGVYAAGVLSHYVTDIFCPLHTGQSKAETVIHRACEWSISCSYDELIDMLEEDLGGFPQVKLPTSNEWIEELLQQEAMLSHESYEQLVADYDFDKGSKNPPAGLNETLSKMVAQLLGRAAAVLALVLERCFQESAQEPPEVSLSLHAALGQATIPVFWITKNMADEAERKIVTKIYEELKRTGNVVKNLPEENRVIAELIEEYRDSKDPERAKVRAAEAAKTKPAESKPRVKVRGTTTEKPISQPEPEVAEQQADDNIQQDVVDPFLEEAAPFGARPIETQQEAVEDEVEDDGGQPKLYLADNSPIVDAPSIGPKTASRFRKIGINTVEDFLDADPETIVKKINTRWITLDLVNAWQQQAELMCSVPGLRGHDTQLLTGIGVENWQDLAAATIEDLHPLVVEYASSPEGQRIIRSGALPSTEEVSSWIENAQWCQSDQAA